MQATETEFENEKWYEGNENEKWDCPYQWDKTLQIGSYQWLNQQWDKTLQIATEAKLENEKWYEGNENEKWDWGQLRQWD